MQNTSNLYKSIINAPNHWFETRLVIDGVGTFGQDNLFSISTSVEMFNGTPTIGTAVAGEIDIKMIKPSAEIPKMATLRPQVRVCNVNNQSEWIPQGVFFVDTRETTRNMDGLDILTIHGFDAMLKAEQKYDPTANTLNTNDFVNLAASVMGVEVDQRTFEIMSLPISLSSPIGYTYREVLGYIAILWVGSFVITDEGKLRLVSLLELPETTNYLINNNGEAITIGGHRILV